MRERSKKGCGVFLFFLCVFFFNGRLCYILAVFLDMGATESFLNENKHECKVF